MAEGVPIVLMEAMALGVPVVATPIMGIPELVDDGHTGLLIPPGRVDVLVDALARLLTDPKLREQLAQEGRRKVLVKFDVNRSARRLLQLLSSYASQEVSDVTGRQAWSALVAHMGRRVGAAADSGTSQAAQHLGARGDDRNASGLSYSTSTSTRRCLEVPPSLPPDLEPSDQRLVFVGGLH